MEKDKTLKKLCIIKELLLEPFVFMLLGFLITTLMQRQLNITDVFIYFVVGSLYSIACSFYFQPACLALLLSVSHSRVRSVMSIVIVSKINLKK